MCVTQGRNNISLLKICNSEELSSQHNLLPVIMCGTSSRRVLGEKLNQTLTTVLLRNGTQFNYRNCPNVSLGPMVAGFPL